MAAGALVLLGLGLFVAGIVTDTTAFYWLCVGVCVTAGVLLVLARLQNGRTAGTRTAPAAASPSTSPSSTTPPATTPPASTPPVPAQDPSEPTSAPVPAADDEPPSAAHAPRAVAAQPVAGDPPVEDVEVTDLLLVVDLRDEVLVVDEHPRYHLGGCRWLTGRTTVPLPIDEARTDGFTPCALCAPDRHLAERERGRRAR